MWTQDELTDLSLTVRKVDISEFCTSEEIAVIGENSTRLRNLKSDIFVPKHKRSVSFLIWLHILIKFSDENNLSEANVGRSR